MKAGLCGPGEVGELEEAAAGVGPAQRLGHGTAGPRGGVEATEAGIGVRLEDAAVAVQVPLGMLAAAVWRVVEEDRGRAVAERPVVADIGPEPAGGGLALRQHRHRRVVAVQALGREPMAADQLVQQRQDGSAGADQVRQRREVEVDTLPCIALALPVERLMLAVLSRRGSWPGGWRRSGRAG